MARGSHYRQLCSELRRLRDHFLPKKWSPTGDYSDRKLDRTRAYRLLAHAEIEYFLEERLWQAVKEEYNNWTNHKQPNYVMTCLISASRIGWHDKEAEELDIARIDPPTIKKNDQSINDIISRAVEQYHSKVEQNNGIKRRNLKELLMPTGISLAELDPTWLANMDSFGGQRGALAHRSRLGLRSPFDPKLSKQAVDDLLVGLEELDKLVSKL